MRWIIAVMALLLIVAGQAWASGVALPSPPVVTGDTK